MTVSLPRTCADVAVGELVVRFALVVLLPLAVGLAVRAGVTELRRYEGELTGGAAVTVVLLVYAAMSGAADEGDLLAALGASALFLALAGLPAAAWARFAARDLRITGALVIGLRDFAVAAALAVQAFGPAAGTVAGVYGVLMLLVGAAAAQLLPRFAGPTRGRRTLSTACASKAWLSGYAAATSFSAYSSGRPAAPTSRATALAS